MSRKISIKDKKEWLAMLEAGKTEAQIAKAKKRDPRTIARGIEEAIKARRITNIEDDILRKAIIDHQAQLMDVLKEIVSILVMPPDVLELREEKDGTLADIPISGGLVKTFTEDQMGLELHVEKKLEWELLQEHLKQEKIWDYLRQWRSALLHYVMAEWQFKKVIKKLLENEGLEFKQRRTGSETDYFLPSLIDLFNGVAVNKILNIPDGTNLEKGIIVEEDGYIRHGPGGTELAHSKNAAERRDKIVSVFTSLPQTPEASQVKGAHGKLDEITKTARREVNELLLLNMVTGRCRVCRRLGR
jgi:hypothetical protein